MRTIARAVDRTSSRSKSIRLDRHLSRFDAGQVQDAVDLPEQGLAGGTDRANDPTLLRVEICPGHEAR